MSQILSTLILTELQKLNTIPDPEITAQQKLFADAVARAVQIYLNTSVTVTTTGGPGKTIAP